MCVTCGCGSDQNHVEGETHAHEHTHADGMTHQHTHADGTTHAHPHGHEQAHGHDHALGAAHAPDMAPSRRVQIEQDILAKNDAIAADNRNAWPTAASSRSTWSPAPGRARRRCS